MLASCLRNLSVVSMRREDDTELVEVASVCLALVNLLHRYRSSFVPSLAPLAPPIAPPASLALVIAHPTQL
jgi:hypothetical protein